MKIKVRKIANHNQILENQCVEFDKGKIKAIYPLDKEDSYDYPLLVPGFIDIHTHGRLGYNTMEIKRDRYLNLSKSFLLSGTTTYVASLLTATLDEIEQVLEFGNDFMSINKECSLNGECADLHGFHLEGPFLSTKNSGAQKPDLIIPFNEKGKELIAKYNKIISMITFDYGNDKAAELADFARKYPIILALGHDETLEDQVYEAFEKGVSLVTHIYCSTSSLFRGVKDGHFKKMLGTQEIALMTKGVSVEVIPDNHHISKSIFKFIRHNKDIEELIAVTDSNQYSGLEYENGQKGILGEMDIILADGVAMLPDKSSLAASIITLMDAFKILVKDWEQSLEDAVALTSYNPAKILGIADNYGAIEVGKKADFVLLDDNYELLDVYKNGVKVNLI